MFTGFYGGHGLLPVLGDESEEKERQQGDLADMVRSSVNRRRRIYSQVSDSASNNHHQIWSLTNNPDADIDDEQQQHDESRVDHRISRSSDDQLLVAYLQYSSGMFDLPLSATTAQHEHLPISSNSLMHHMIVKSQAAAAGGGGGGGGGHRHDHPETGALAPAAAAINMISSINSGDTTQGHTSSSKCVAPPKPPINCNVFSQMLHISSSTNDMLAPPPSSIGDLTKQQHQQQTLAPISSSFAVVGVGSSRDIDHIRTNSSNSSVDGGMTMLLNDDHRNRNRTTFTASRCDTLLHISSSRNPATKRSRKSLAKKVICIPAPAPANSRPCGEVVPSDLWAWRKYGQKPIKGSPYPRGYYRCSSSKGCSARKQVERSKTDPNMLVITYTSEHNHPWPTQRNALAGSTRFHPSKNICDSSSWTGVLVDDDDDQMKRSSSGGGAQELKPAEMVINQQKVDGHIVASEQDYSNNQQDSSCRVYEADERWRCTSYNRTTYRPRTTPDECNEQSQDDDFFAELGELAGKDHNGFSSFLMDWPSSQDHDKAVI